MTIQRWIILPFAFTGLASCTDVSDDPVDEQEAALAADLPPIADNCFLAVALCVTDGTNGRTCWESLLDCETPIGHGDHPGAVPPVATGALATPPADPPADVPADPPAEQAFLPDEGRNDEVPAPPNDALALCRSDFEACLTDLADGTSPVACVEGLRACVGGVVPPP